MKRDLVQSLPTDSSTTNKADLNLCGRSLCVCCGGGRIIYAKLRSRMRGVESQ